MVISSKPPFSMIMKTTATSVWAATAALAFGSAAGFRIAAFGTLAATAAIVVHLVRARMLSDVAEGQRFPGGALRPSLLYSIAPGGH